MVIPTPAQPLPLRLRAASLAVALLGGLALAYGLWDVGTLPAARAAPYRAWQQAHVWPVVVVGAAYLLATTATFGGRALARPSMRFTPTSWLMFGTLGHQALLAMLILCLWRGPRSRLLLAGHDELAAALLTISLLACLVSWANARWARRVQVEGIVGAGPKLALGEIVLAQALFLLLAVLEASAISRPAGERSTARPQASPSATQKSERPPIAPRAPAG